MFTIKLQLQNIPKSRFIYRKILIVVKNQIEPNYTGCWVYIYNFSGGKRIHIIPTSLSD